MDNFQLTLDQAARDLLPVCVRIYIFVYVVFAGFHVLMLPADIAGLMVGGSLLCIFTGFAVRANMEHPLVQQNAERVLVLMLLLMIVNVVMHSGLTNDIRQNTNLIFVMAIAGYLLPDSRNYYPTVGIAIACWLFLFLTIGDLHRDSFHFGFELFMGTVFSFFLHILRRSQLDQFGQMQTALQEAASSRARTAAPEKIFRSLLDDLPTGIVVSDSDARVIYANADALRQLGHEEGLADWTLLESSGTLVTIDGRELAPEEYPFARVHNTRVPVLNEVVGNRRQDGQTNWGLVNAFPVELGGDQGSVTTIAFVDITEQVNTQFRLRESESRDSMILNSVREAVVSVDHKNRISLFNPAAEILTGISVETALGLEFNEVVQFADDESASTRSDEPTIKRGIVKSVSGEKISVELLVSETYESGAQQGRVYTFRDVREQVKIEHERATLDKMSSVGILAAGIAHDFNNVLTAIYGNVALAESVLPPNEKAHEFLRRSSESIQLATNLTKQLLTFSRGSEPVRRLMDIEPLVRDATHFALSGSAVFADITVKPSSFGVEADAGQLQQAIGNIVLNANQAMDGEGTIRISVECLTDHSSGAEFVITIADDGPGMEPELLQKIFDPYFTTRPQGTGLGLATTHSIITKHGGSVVVESETGQGTVFVIRLPAVTLEGHPGAALPLPMGEDELLRVLVMDDDEVVLETVCRLLEQFGHEVEGVPNGEEAIKRYRNWLDNEARFDFVIMDLTIAGGMGGMAAAQQILSFDPDAKLVVTSGYSEGAEMARYDELGFVARLEKPFRTSDLQAVIAEVMQA